MMTPIVVTATLPSFSSRFLLLVAAQCLRMDGWWMVTLPRPNWAVVSAVARAAQHTRCAAVARLST